MPSTARLLGREVPESDESRTLREELTEALIGLRQELGTLVGTEQSPFSGVAVEESALEEIRELIFGVSIAQEDLPALAGGPCWDAVSWIVEKSLNSLSEFRGDPATDPVLEAVERTDQAMKNVHGTGQ